MPVQLTPAEYAQTLLNKFSKLMPKMVAKEAAIYCINEQLKTVTRILSHPHFKMQDECPWYGEENNFLIDVFKELQKL